MDSAWNIDSLFDLKPTQNSFQSSDNCYTVTANQSKNDNTRNCAPSLSSLSPKGKNIPVSIKVKIFYKLSLRF